RAAADQALDRADHRRRPRRAAPRRPPSVHPAGRAAVRDAGRPYARRAPARIDRRELVAGGRQQGHVGRGGRCLMLSRVAERVYWMGRYVERAESTARLVNAYTMQVMALPIGAEGGWKPPGG